MTFLVGLVQRAARLQRRRSAARRLGLRFDRASSFVTPSTIVLNDRDIELAVPDEHGLRVAFVELLLDDCYRLRWVARRARIGTIVDIGANVGLFGLAARSMFPDAIIHAYEPNPLLELALAHHAQVANFDYFLAAVGRDAGTACLEVHAKESVLTRSVADPGGPIAVVPFREALARIGGRADLVKMDCEGAEWAILEDRETWQRVDYLTMEYHLASDQDHKVVVGALEGIGFVVHDHRPATNFGLVLAERRGR